MIAKLLLALLLAVGFTPSTAGPLPAVPANEYGLRVVGSAEGYRREIMRERRASLVDLGAFVPGLRVRLAYARRDNPTGRVLYDARRAYLRLPAAVALREVQRDLASRGLGLLVFDAYRPYAATLALWDAVGDPTFAAPPWSGSRHNRGAAVDLTLVRLASGRPLPMPTAYDSFSRRASHDYDDLPQTVRRNRDLLRSAMARHGFLALRAEWWHYDYEGWARFGLLDVGLAAAGSVPPRADVWLSYPPLARLSLLVPAD